MHLLRDTSISRKLKVVILTTTSVALLLASAAFVAYDRIVFRQSMASDLSTLAKVIGTNSTAAITFNDRDSAKDVLSALTAKPNIVRARIYDSDSDLFAEYVRDGESGDLPLTVQRVSQVAFTDAYLVASETIELDGDTIGTVYLISNLDTLRSRLNRHVGVVAAVLFGSLLVAFLLSSKLQSLISGPISHLAKTARAVSVDKDYSIRAVKRGRDEMGMLIDGFNEMLGQIQERDAELQRARDELEQRVEERTKELKDEIAERKRIEDVLRHSEEHFRSLIENASDVITVLDLDGTIRYESPSVERVMGYKPEELTGRNANEFAHPDDDPATSVLMAELGAPAEGPVSLEVRFKHRSGEWRTLEVFRRLIQDESGASQIIINSRDITERKQAEETLRESEAVFRSLADTVSAAIYIYQGSKFIYVNPAAETITGYTHDELMGMEVWNILHPDSLEGAKAHADLRQKGEVVPAHSETQILTKTGEVRWLDITPCLIRFKGQQVVLATAFDITERKGWEDAIRESEEKYRTILQSIQEGYYEVDLTGNLTFFNDSLSRIIGSSPERLMGLNNRDYTDRETAGRIYAAFNQVFRSGEPLEDFQYRIVTGAGVHKFLETSILLKRNSTGQISGFRGTVRDITARKHAEESLRESEQRYKTLFDAATDGIVILSTDGEQAGQILAANKATAETTGYTVDELLELNISDLLTPEHRHLVERSALPAVTSENITVEVLRRRKDGTTFPVEINAGPLRIGDENYILGFARDITERKQIENEVTMLAHAVRSIKECVSITDTDHVVLFVNDAFVRTYGFERDELIGKKLIDLVRLDSLHFDGDPLVEPAPSQGWEGELLNRRKDGTVFTIHLTVSPIHDESGRTIALVGVSQDITERKRAEEALRASEEQYRLLFQRNLAGVYRASLEGKLLDCNEAAIRILGYDSIQEALLHSLWEFYYDPAERQAMIQQLVEQRSITNLEARCRNKNGEIVWVLANVSLLEGSNGSPDAIEGTLIDITARKQAEKEVTMLAHAVRSIQECVSITDNEEIVLFVNDAFLKTYGLERDEVIGKCMPDLVLPQSNLSNIGVELPPRHLSIGWEGELINRRKDGTEFPIHLSASPISDESGQTIALVGVAQDITDRKRAIEELQKAKEAAEGASRAKSEFLANMSHEIRTPMNGIIGMTELALDTDLTAEQQEYLKLVKLSADSLLGVINDILDFSKIEAGKLDLDLDEFNLVDGVDDVMKTLGVRAEQKGLELAYYLRPGVPEVVVGDLGRLRQVLVNLVGNAIKFTDRGEVIVRVDVETQTDEEVVLHFGIRDTGIGVPHAKQKMIFESFTQADGSTTRKYGGTGLGLAISAQLVHMMRGEIWVESPVDLPGRGLTAGSMFHVTARFGIPQSPLRVLPQHEQLTLAGLPVLVVDDNATNRRILEVQLANWQMRPTAVEGATSALNAIRQAEASGSPFKLALLDYHMPEIDGLGLAEKIKALPGGGDIRIIMMSSSVHQNHARQRILRIDASLVKPVKAAELLGVIRAVFGTDADLPVRPRSARLKTANPSRILVAEDSLINQALIKRLLEKWGHTPLIAENGTDALALLDCGQFELILMDLQMPEINGFEATATIRQKERGTDRHIPIIALTAHALKGDRERCIEAGMDDYVSKPIESQKLFDAVEAAAAQSAPATTNGRSHRGVLDIDALVKSFEGDRELVLMLARVFADSSRDQLSALCDAVERGDADALASAAHALKGSVANFRANAAVDAASQLELMGRHGDLSLADSALANLEKEIERVREDLEAFELVSLS